MIGRRSWTSKEDEIIREYWPDGGMSAVRPKLEVYAQCVKVCGGPEYFRSAASITNRASKLKVYVSVQVRARINAAACAMRKAKRSGRHMKPKTEADYTHPFNQWLQSR